MAFGIQKLKDDLAAAKRSRAMQRVKARTLALQHTMVATGAAYAIGRIEKGATQPLPTLFNLDPKLMWGGAAMLVSTSVPGKMGEAVAAVGDGLFCAYGYSEGLGTGYTIRGETHDDDDIDI
jgi:hypothetical protein